MCLSQVRILLGIPIGGEVPHLGIHTPQWVYFRWQWSSLCKQQWTSWRVFPWPTVYSSQWEGRITAPEACLHTRPAPTPLEDLIFLVTRGQLLSYKRPYTARLLPPWRLIIQRHRPTPLIVPTPLYTLRANSLTMLRFLFNFQIYFFYTSFSIDSHQNFPSSYFSLVVFCHSCFFLSIMACDFSDFFMISRFSQN